MKNIDSVLLLSVAFAGGALAHVKTYTNRATWTTAVSNPTTINFGSAAPVSPAAFRSYQTPPGFTLSGVNCSSTKTGGIVSVTSQTYCCNTYLRGFDQFVSNYDGIGIMVTLPPGVTAFGFDLLR